MSSSTTFQAAATAAVRQAADTVRGFFPADDQPKVAVIAGSGLGTFSDMLEVERAVPYDEIPGFPVSTVVGHAGKLLAARADGRPIVVLSGRSHLYEGHDVGRAVFGVRVLGALGVETLIVSNAAGGLNRNFTPNELMLIRDHINLMWQNPLIGPNDDAQGPRFPDMSEPYDRELGEIALDEARRQGLVLREGTYLAGTGPSYETRAEVRMLQFMGADAVGMSTVIETIAARHLGMRVLGISLISNSLVLESTPVTTHDEVMEAGRVVAEKFGKLVRGIVGRL
jgi:purine-nucleoside phosphorylase